jgi:hypothetical protein
VFNNVSRKRISSLPQESHIDGSHADDDAEGPHATVAPLSAREAHDPRFASTRRLGLTLDGPGFRGFSSERVTGIEPALSAWEADVLPLNYTREPAKCYPKRSVYLGLGLRSRGQQGR